VIYAPLHQLFALKGEVLDPIFSIKFTPIALGFEQQINHSAQLNHPESPPSLKILMLTIKRIITLQLWVGLNDSETQ